ncbi:MAG: CHRD domain-containing protein [Rhodospirillaceae bacterium]|nr:CHRD domain-containing protein [Rhodospirillaceae bacterium]
MGSALVWSILLAQGEQFDARLSTVPIDMRNRVEITGLGRATAVLDGSELTVAGTYQGLQGPANAAYLHESLVTGVRGPAILDLEVSGGIEGSISATLDLTPDLVVALRGGRLYIQIHSEAAPDGNLWGWLLQ